MYPVSEEYKEQIKKPSRSFFWTGIIVTQDGKEYPFQNSDIVKGSGYISRQCSGSSEIELGTVYAAELGLSLFFEADRYTLYGATISLFFHLCLPDGQVETIPMGVFYIAEANRYRRTIELKAYDRMLNLDKNFNQGLSSATAFDFLNLLSQACHVELAQTQEEIQALTNGTELFGIYQENDIETWRDFLYYLAQALGCFATIDRFGKLLLVPYGNTGVKSIDSSHRFSSSFSDFVTRYTAISVTNRKTNVAEYYSLDPDDGLTMNLGTNPLLQFGLEETRTRILGRILDAISVVEYVPFDSDTIGDPSLDLGDVLQFTGGQSDETKRSAITHIETKINGKQSIKCVGKNPRLSQAKSKNDKNISGLISSIDETRLSIYSFINALPIELGEERCPIVQMEFALGNETNAEFHAQVILQISSVPETRSVTAETTVDFGTGSEDSEEKNEMLISFPITWDEDGRTHLQVDYILDGHMVEEFHPAETWGSGKHLLNLYYPILDLEENQLHTFEVFLTLTGGTGKVDAQNVLATIAGQGLGAQERWDGRITASDILPPILLRSMPTHILRETSSVWMDVPRATGGMDSMTSILLTGMPVPGMRDQVSLFAPIVRDVIEIPDKNKMLYNKTYVVDEERFALRSDYSITGGTESRLDRGRMIRLTIPTDPFESLTSVTILPFDTLPFVNKNILHATVLAMTDFTQLVEEKAMLKGQVELDVHGTDMEIDRGRLAAFPLGMSNMESIKHMEVTNA